ncbi:hypothetical protein K469DRAFT_707611 [Zopfia rhizophila CBS 207.26]|uniref:Uncharacterized protein n=1 Tax=Zopfia rhizophila CBS 207.26 TaxID=1314779 RepID=A0A6A6E611_9PEZI|nr:hypothetical protein K469DRAFT_707611 [Zopfia rhizophila CBS 207.26]
MPVPSSAELLPNSQQTLWKRYEDQVLIEHPSSGCIQMVLEGRAVSMRKSDCWLNATQEALVCIWYRISR